MTERTPLLHPKFTLNGFAHSESTLMDAAYSLIKEGDPFELVIGDFLMDWLSDSDTITFKTSGTTGSPKMKTFTRHQMIASAKLTGAYFKLSPGQSVLMCLPAEYVAGKMMLVRAMVLGLQLHFVEPITTPIPYEKQFDFAAMVPMQLQASLKQLHQIDQLIVGGAPISQELIRDIANVPTDIYETYGMTETLTHVAVKKLNHTLSGIADDTFKALPGIEFETDARSCLVVTASHLDLHKCVTNDVVTLLNDKEFTWLGRIDNVINSGAVKVHPEYVESILRDAFKCEIIVAGVPDPQLGERVLGIVETEDLPDKYMELLDSIEELDAFHKPREIKAISEFTRNDSGKIDRNTTLEQLNLK
ncbi:MAG: AMP-binding protein [Bacteroidia bacterium]|nr:AMP-binding protein [Bacteroidia bacterium]